MNLYLKNSHSGLSLVPKLKYEHVYLTSFSKMRVDLAAQVCHVHCVWYNIINKYYHTNFCCCKGDELNSGRGSTYKGR